MPHAFKLAHRLSRLRAPGFCFALAALGACETTRSVSVPVNPTIASVVVTPDSVTLTPNQTSQFYAYGRTTAGDSVPVTATWSATGGSISPTGLFTAGSGMGTYSVDAQVATVHGHGHVHVKSGSVASVTVSPVSTTGNVGYATQFTATLTDATGNVITGDTVTWSSTNTAVVTVSATGYGTAVGPGSAAIVATSQGKSGQSQITVNGASGPGPATSVTVSPGNASIAVGGTQAFSAVLKDAAGNVTSGPVTWSSSAPTIAGISNTGVATGLLAGTATITATSGSVSGTASLTATPAPAASVTVSPASASIAVGGTQAFSAVLKDANGNVVTGAVTWSSSAPTIAGISLTGVVTGLLAGTSTITATSGSVRGTASLTVTPAPVASVTVSPASASINVGATQAFSAVLKDGNGNVVTGAVTWSSSAPTIAGISLTGVVTGLLAGTSTITATSGSVSGTGSVTVTVLPPPPPSWPNAPSGLTVLSDQPWNTLGSWVLNDNTAGHTSLVTLSGLPFSPSGALQDLSPIGMTGGGDAIGPGRADFYIPSAQQPTEIYVGMWVKLSNPYQPHSSGVQKIMYLHDNNGVNFSALWLEIYGTGAPFRASLVNQFYGCPSIRLDPNVTQTPIGPGEWHRYEMYVKMASTGSTSDGVLKVWVDGVLNVNRTDLCTQGSNTYKMESVRLSGMWGGIGDAKTEVDYLWYDHTYVSGR